jgi:hypothetical protein
MAARLMSAPVQTCALPACPPAMTGSRDSKCEVHVHLMLLCAERRCCPTRRVQGEVHVRHNCTSTGEYTLITRVTRHSSALLQVPTLLQG